MNETQKITQPLWNKKTYKGDDLIQFYLPELSNSRTNEIQGIGGGYIPAGNVFSICQLILLVDGKETSHRFLDHMIKYSYVSLRVIDRDYLMLPCFCMERKERSLSFTMDIPITIMEYVSTCMNLYFSKKFKGNVDIMCLYMGEYGRRLI